MAVLPWIGAALSVTVTTGVSHPRSRATTATTAPASDAAAGPRVVNTAPFACTTGVLTHDPATAVGPPLQAARATRMPSAAIGFEMRMELSFGDLGMVEGGMRYRAVRREKNPRARAFVTADRPRAIG